MISRRPARSRLRAIGTLLIVARLCLGTRSAAAQSSSSSPSLASPRTPPRFDVDLPWNARPDPTRSRPWAYLEAPLLDVPYNIDDAFWFPSMRQSLAISAAITEGSHAGIEASFLGIRNGYARMGLAIGLSGAFDFLFMFLPLGPQSNHEEFHRAVLASRGIHSFNGYYTFPFGQEFVSVDHVADADLAALKHQHPAEFVRMSSAGMEGNFSLARTLEMHRFFLDTRATFGAALVLNIALPMFYYGLCSPGSDAQVRQLEHDEGTNVAIRDFTGLDCNAWVYDLFRPNEPYDARGVHPSGVGIRRYRQSTDLTANESSYLQLQTPLSFLNLLNPFLIGFNGFRGRSPLTGQPMRWTAEVVHMLTPFGFVIDANAFWHEPRLNLMASLHSYFAGYTYMPGLDLTLVRWPLFGVGTPWLLTLRAGLWLQPQRQLMNGTAWPGGIASARLTYAWHNVLEFWAEVEGKTAGWVAAVEPLDAAVDARIGVSLLIPGPRPRNY